MNKTSNNRAKDMLIHGRHKIKRVHSQHKEKVPQKQNKYVEDLFHNERGETCITQNIEGSEIAKSKVRLTLDKINSNKKVVQGVRVIEMLADLNDFGINKDYRNK